MVPLELGVLPPEHKGGGGGGWNDLWAAPRWRERPLDKWIGPARVSCCGYRSPGCARLDSCLLPNSCCVARVVKPRCQACAGRPGTAVFSRFALTRGRPSTEMCGPRSSTSSNAAMLLRWRLHSSGIAIASPGFSKTTTPLPQCRPQAPGTCWRLSHRATLTPPGPRERKLMIGQPLQRCPSEAHDTW
jgi:hypothetical protein